LGASSRRILLHGNEGASAAGHVMWNFLAKQSRNKLVFIWGLYALAVPAFLPLYLWRGLDADLGAGAWACILASGASKAVYIIFIAEALHAGDLSITYPLSRIAPAIVPFWAVAFLGERLSVLGALGIAVVWLGKRTGLAWCAADHRAAAGTKIPRP
jgi:uncharacterized membrane protein